VQARTIKELEEEIAELKRRIPPHSVPPAMIRELEELEEQLDKAREMEKGGGGSPKDLKG
jgi:predicted RNase H-like nuclease (RuvC/YqgF family)